jgi:hypothetical protein
MRTIKQAGITWWGNPGSYDCRSARVFCSIVGTWAFVARIGWRGKRGVASATGCRTMREAMSFASAKENRLPSCFIQKRK